MSIGGVIAGVNEASYHAVVNAYPLSPAPLSSAAAGGAATVIPETAESDTAGYEKPSAPEAEPSSPSAPEAEPSAPEAPAEPSAPKAEPEV